MPFHEPQSTLGMSILERPAFLLAERLSRSDLLTLAPRIGERRVKLHLLRNHGVEHCANLFPSLLSPWRLEMEYGSSSYDDSLQTSGIPDCDVILVWVEAMRLELSKDPSLLARWLGDRIRSLRTVTHKPVVLVCPVLGETSCLAPSLLRQELEGLHDILLADPSRAMAMVGAARMFDRRAEAYSGTPFSSAFLAEMARSLCAGPLSQALGLVIKGLVLDLDNTLYRGVLGEDEPEGLKLSPEHRALQEALVALQKKGMLLALLSKNAPQDVEKLFAVRTDFPLRPEHVARMEIGWRPKHEGMSRILEGLNIGPESLVFVDDNPGELMEMHAAFRQIHLIPAHDPVLCARGLQLYPGIAALTGGTRESGLRTRDIQARQVRDELRIAGSPEDYLADLKIQLSYHLNDPRHIARVAELSGKTNQFNLTLARLGATRVEELNRSANGFVVAIGLSDRLSNSGIVCGLCGHSEQGLLCVEDLVISCRALGRQIETAMLAHAFRLLADRFSCTHLELPWRSGPRNQPALSWLASLEGRVLDESPLRLPIPPLPKLAELIAFQHPSHE